jgi:hypothetical protein
MQYYACKLLKKYPTPSDTFEIIIPNIKGVYLSNEPKSIEIHSDYKPNAPNKKYTIKNLQEIISENSQERIQEKIIKSIRALTRRSSMNKKHQGKTKKQQVNNDLVALDKALTHVNDNFKISSNTRKSRSVSVLPNNKEIRIIIKLHNTIVQFFEYLKSNGLLHLDSKIKNVYFNGNKLIIIDFGESYILDVESRSKSYEDIYLEVPIQQHDNIIYSFYETPKHGYHASHVITNMKDYNSSIKENIRKWLFEIDQGYIPSYGGGLKPKN